MNWLLIASALLVPTPGRPTQPPAYVTGLPVTSGLDASDGPWLVSIWPDEGCKDSKFDANDVAAYRVVRDALMSKSERFAEADTAQFIVVDSLTTPDKVSNFAAFRAELQKCKFNAEGVTRRPKKAGDGRSFAIEFTCPDKERNSYLALNFRDRKLDKAYWMPNGPVLVVVLK